MIDDFVPISLSFDGTLRPWNDWGYGKKGKNSLFEYLDSFLFQKFPEIKGTFFIPLQSQDSIPEDSGMNIKKQLFDERYVSFFKSFKDSIDVAFHGIRHTWFDNNSIKGKMNFEFSHLTLKNSNELKDKIEKFEKLYSLKITGGKFPGYHRKNEDSFELLFRIGMKWWAFSLADSKIAQNDFRFLHTSGGELIDVPSNLNGNAFVFYLNQSNASVKNKILNINKFYKHYKIYNYIDYLYSNKLPITIQEHAQNQGSNGKRQKPNLFDDMSSLEKIYGILRNADIWHASCSELAHYYDCYKKTLINEKDNGDVEISYQGNWDQLFLSFISNKPQLKEVSSGKVIFGVLKHGLYIFNGLKTGIYH